MPLQCLIDGFPLSCRVEKKSLATISFYHNILNKFQWFLQKCGVDTIDTTTVRTFMGYVKDSPNRWDSTNRRANRPVYADTVDRYYTGLSALFRWALNEGLVGTNPTAAIKKPRFQRKITRGIEPDICNKLIGSFNGKNLADYRSKTILMVFLDTGLRLSELANLTMNDINMEQVSSRL